MKIYRGQIFVNTTEIETMRLLSVIKSIRMILFYIFDASLYVMGIYKIFINVLGCNVNFADFNEMIISRANLHKRNYRNGNHNEIEICFIRYVI